MRTVSDTAKMIKALRRMRYMTQAELAKAAGLERTSITNIETGRQQLTESTVNAIAEALGCTVQIRFVPKRR